MEKLNPLTIKRRPLLGEFSLIALRPTENTRYHSKRIDLPLNRVSLEVINNFSTTLLWKDHQGPNTLQFNLNFHSCPYSKYCLSCMVSNVIPFYSLSNRSKIVHCTCSEYQQIE